MKHIVYLTKNQVNNKIYIGVHQVEDVNIIDSYLGCGVLADSPKTYNKCETPFAAAVNKYGPQNFKRTTLKVFDDRKEALRLEAILVNEDFIKKSFNYNCVVGGGDPPVLSKKIYQYDLNGKFIKEWEPIKSAADFYNITHVDGFSFAAKNKKSYKESYWTFEKFDVLNLSEYTEIKYTTGVCIYNSNGTLLNQFNSIAEAERTYDLKRGAISKALIDKSKVQGLIVLRVNQNIDDYFTALENFTRVNSTKIYKYDGNTGLLIKKYDTMESCRIDNHIGLKTIHRIIKDKEERNGYLYSYYEVENILKEHPSTIIPNKPIAINQIDPNTNILIKTWELAECRKLYPSCIKVCRGALPLAYGYKWEYVLQS